jgi:hypothetical protein
MMLAGRRRTQDRKGDGMSTRVALTSDLRKLADMDMHVSPDVLGDLVSAARVMVGEADGLVVGCLRWGLFWDQVPGTGSSFGSALRGSLRTAGRVFVALMP